jgi:hypothetical protein
MTRLKRFTMAAFAAATVAVGSFATTSTASALPISCNLAAHIAHMYMMTGNAMAEAGLMTGAYYWWGRAVGVMEGACD